MRDKKINKLLASTQNNEKHIEQLIRLSGGREPIDPDCSERVRAHVYEVWLAQQQKRSRFARLSRLWHKPVALVAGLLLVGVGALGFYLSTIHPSQTSVVAAVENLRCEVPYRGTRLQQNAAIYVGTTLDSSNLDNGNACGLSLRMSGGGILKLDRNTRVSFLDSHELKLEAGALYFDSRQRDNIRIHTPLGIASDLGTRFETRLQENELIVRVRDGMVQVERGKDTLIVDSGQALQLANGTTNLTELATGDEHWIWVDAIDDTFSFDGRSIAEILFWLAQQENWQVRYQNEADKQRAREDIFHGELDTTSSEAVLQQLSLVSDMRYRLDESVLLVTYP